MKPEEKMREHPDSQQPLPFFVVSLENTLDVLKDSFTDINPHIGKHSIPLQCVAKSLMNHILLVCPRPLNRPFTAHILNISRRNTCGAYNITVTVSHLY